MNNPEHPSGKFLKDSYGSPESGDLGSRLAAKIRDSGGQFSETIKINHDGTLDLMDLSTNKESVLAPLASKGIEELYALALDLESLFPNLRFAFDRSLEDSTITYSVMESSSEH